MKMHKPPRRGSMRLTAPNRDYQPPGGHASLTMVSHFTFLLSHLGHLISFSSEGPPGTFTRNLPPHCWHRYSHGGGPVSRLQAVNPLMSLLAHRGHFISSPGQESKNSNNSWQWLHKYFIDGIFSLKILYTMIPDGKHRVWQESLLTPI